MGKTLALLLIFLIDVVFCEEPRPLVETPLGYIKGYHSQSFDGRTFSSFQGIRYAKPPVGELRFKEPQPFGPWKGIWNAEKSTACVYTTYITGVIQGDEDCLFLNVYVPREQPNPDDKFDVIVEIHASGFMVGSAQEFINPAYFMDRDIILVSINYRLNIFGFLYTEDDTIPGNLGLKDQTLALKWVKDNIASFGGNPDSITLDGLSAGGTSVHLHYLSPLSKGLFHRGLAHSGTALNVFALQQSPLDKAQRLARSVGCPDSPNKDLVDCLRQKPAKDLAAEIQQFFGCYTFPIAPFNPVIEKDAVNPFLDKHPYYKLVNGEIADLPLIMSNTLDEGYLITLFPSEEIIKEIDERWEECARYILDYNYTLAKPLHISTAKEVKEFYLGKDEKFSDDKGDKLIQLVGDRYFKVDAELAIKQQAKVNKSPVYYYHFTYPGDFLDKCYHGCDLKYFFYSTVFPVNLTETEIKMKDRLIDMTVSFAKTGVPDIGFEWKPTGHKQLTYLDVSHPDKMDLLIVDEFTPIKFWQSLTLLENQNLFLFKDEL